MQIGAIPEKLSYGLYIKKNPSLLENVLGKNKTQL
jgi:hypothetical protein